MEIPISHEGNEGAVTRGSGAAASAADLKNDNNGSILTKDQRIEKVTCQFFSEDIYALLQGTLMVTS